MKSLIKNYIDLLTIEKLNNFGIKNNIYLTNEELQFLLNLVKSNYEDILNNEDKYLNVLKQNFSEDKYLKIKNLFLHYKNKYKGYLF